MQTFADCKPWEYLIKNQYLPDLLMSHQGLFHAKVYHNLAINT